MKKRLAILLLAGTFFWTGCGSSNDFVFTNTNNPGIATPVCQDDTYTTNANTTLTVPAATGVLANDTPNGATLTFPSTSTQGGTITGTQDGGFTYAPPANFSGTDAFSYTLGNSGGVVTCTVTITVVAVNGFFVDAATGSDTTGSFTGGKPFATIQAAAAAAPAGSDIVVRPGNYTGTITLENGDRLLGSGSTLITPQGVTRPVLTGPVVLADGNTLDFLRIANSPGIAIDADNQTGGTVTNCEVATNGGNQPGFSAFPATGGSWNISNNSFNNIDGSAILFTIEGSNTATARINNNQITGSLLNAIGFITSASSNLRAQVAGNTMTGNQTGFTFEIIAGGTSTSCYDIEGNTNDDTYLLQGILGDTPVFQVEDLANLIAINNNSGVVSSPGGTTPPTSVANGTCGF